MSKEESFYGSKGATDTDFRRKWDRAEFARKAEERQKAEADEEKLAKQRRALAEQRTLLQAREYKMNFEEKLNKTVIVAANAPLSQQPGYYCDVCNCVVRDSINYLDHVNGKRHQSKLGMSMKVERSTVDQVRDRLEALKRKKNSAPEVYDFEARVEKAKQEEDDRKRQKREREKEKEQEKKRKANPGNEEVDPEMANTMGFADFGSSKK